jgi:hypothetical protein
MGFNKLYEYPKSIQRQTIIPGCGNPEGGQSIARLQGFRIRNKWINCDFEYRLLIQKIHEFDIFVAILTIRFKLKYGNQNPFPKFKWQDSYYDHYIRNDNEFDNFLDYIDYNPTKHGLPNDWPYVFTNPKYDKLTDNIL